MHEEQRPRSIPRYDESVIDTEPIREFVLDHYHLPSRKLRSIDDEIYPRLIDARDVLEVMDWVEETYDVYITEAETLAFAEIFRTLRTIAEYIGHKRAGASEVAE